MREKIKQIWKVLWDRKKLVGRLDGSGIDPFELAGENIEKYEILRKVKKDNPDLADVVLVKMAARAMDASLTLDINDPNYDKKEILLKGEAHVLITLLQEMENEEFLLGVSKKELEKLQDERRKR